MRGLRKPPTTAPPQCRSQQRPQRYSFPEKNQRCDIECFYNKVFSRFAVDVFYQLRNLTFFQKNVKLISINKHLSKYLTPTPILAKAASSRATTSCPSTPSTCRFLVHRVNTALTAQGGQNNSGRA